MAVATELRKTTEGWTVIRDDQGVVLEARPREGSYINCYRVTGKVPRAPKEAADAFWAWGKDEWQRMSADVQEFEVVVPSFVAESKGEGQGQDLDLDLDMKVVYQRVALPWPLWHRDVCLLMWKTRDEDEGSHGVMVRSIAHELAPEKPQSYVRATVLLGGYVFLPVEGDSSSSLVVRIVHVEPNGSIPSTIVNMKAGELHQQMLSFQALF
jgi:hypothetical protein